MFTKKRRLSRSETLCDFRTICARAKRETANTNRAINRLSVHVAIVAFDLLCCHAPQARKVNVNNQMHTHGRKEAGFSLIELLIVVAIILIIAAIAIPNLLRARMAANESSAVASIRTINTAQITYNSTYPTVGFGASLTVLGGVAPCTPASTTACLIDSVLAAGVKSGYNFATAGCRWSSGHNLLTRRRFRSPSTRLVSAASARLKTRWFACSPRAPRSPAKRLARLLLPLNQ